MNANDLRIEVIRIYVEIFTFMHGINCAYTVYKTSKFFKL